MYEKIANAVRSELGSARNLFVRALKRRLSFLGFELVRCERDLDAARVKTILNGLMELASLEKLAGQSEEVQFLIFAARLLHVSKSQLLQDLFVLQQLREKTNGYFVEFGATNGVDGSNSFALERHYGWHGILAEPARMWHKELRVNRGCRIDHRCVWSETGQQLEFNQVSEPELSTIHRFSSSDRYSKSREQGERYYVETVSLNDLLESNGAPSNIDYLSIDTEGSEFEVLRAFDFERYRIRIITCEHNYTGAREKIYELLTSKGYARKFERLSAVDDWYVKA